MGKGAGIRLLLEGLVASAYLAILLAVAGRDWKTKKIDDRFHLGILALGGIALWLFPEHTAADRLLGAVVVALPMAVLSLRAGGAFGGGDIKLMAASGFLLGWRAVLVAWVCGLAGSGVYGLWALAKGRTSRRGRMALGPFLAAGLMIALFCGDAVASRYLRGGC